MLDRRELLKAAGGALAALALPGCLSAPTPLEELGLSAGALDLIEEAWVGLDPQRFVDVHMHAVGLGAGGTGCFVHPESHSWLSPVRKVKTRIYKRYAGVYDDDEADQQFVARLVDLCEYQAPRGRGVILAFDQYHTEDGEPSPEHSEFYVPNDYVFQLCEDYPHLFLPGCSVHPYRADALEELSRCADRGAVCVKWLPNAMRIDPLDPRCEAFYGLMAERGLTLLSHTGEEQAVDAEELQELGNPLRLRPALQAGVKVVLAHVGSLGENHDLDQDPTTDGDYPHATSLDLALRVLGEPAFAELAYADISATTQFNRAESLLPLLRNQALHRQLVNGSDYPLPAIDPLVRTGLLEDMELLAPDERELINEIYDYNPLTFDFVLKRRLCLRESGNEYRFADSVFQTAHLYSL